MTTTQTTVPPTSTSSSDRPVTRRRRMSRFSAARWIANVLLILVGIAFVVPLLWVILASLDPQANLKVKVPEEFTFDNYSAVLTVDTTFRPMLNGLILCGGATILAIVAATFAAYPLSRYKSRFNRPFLLTILFSTGLPITAVMVPVYGVFVQMRLDDTYIGTILFMAASALPFSIWLMKNFMDGVPISLEEAAWVDGATNLQALRRVVLPLMWPGAAVVTIFTFIGMWGNFFVPFILLLDPEKLPASVSIFNFFNQYGQVQYGQLAAFSVLYTMPVVLLYILLSKRLGGAFNLGGALKG